MIAVCFCAYLKITIVLVGQRSSGGGLQLSVVLSHQLLIDLDLRRSQCGGGGEFESGVSDQLAGQPEERLFEVVVALSGDFEVLQVLLAVERNGTGLDLAFLDVDLVTAENDGDVLANTLQVTVPVGHVLVSDTRSNVEHDDTTLALDVVTVAKTSELLLSRSVPNVEANGTEVGVELEGVDLDTESGDVLLLELSGQVTLDEGGLSCTTVTDEDELELGDFGVFGGHLGMLCVYEGLTGMCEERREGRNEAQAVAMCSALRETFLC